MNYDEAVAWLYATQLHGIHLGLENIHQLAKALGIRVSGPEAPRRLLPMGSTGRPCGSWSAGATRGSATACCSR